ncbi:MAG: antitoxin family protein [Planctomycetota bacterium]
MTEVCEAVYENGVFKPTGVPSNIREGQRVNIVCDDPSSKSNAIQESPLSADEFFDTLKKLSNEIGPVEMAKLENAISRRAFTPPEEPFEMKPAVYATPEEIMNALQSMYDGWSQEEIKDFESIILDRSNFRTRRD